MAKVFVEQPLALPGSAKHMILHLKSVWYIIILFVVFYAFTILYS